MNDGVILPLTRPLVDGPSAWKGIDLRQQPEKWIYRLSKDEIAEIEAATDAAMATGKAMADITKEDFVLPNFAKRLTAILDGLFDGYGFIVIRGFPTGGHPILRNAITFWAIFWDTCVMSDCSLPAPSMHARRKALSDSCSTQMVAMSLA